MKTFSDLIFLKLGGSLITDKNRPHTPRLEVIARLAEEVALAQGSHPELRIVLGHGSGSFGHIPARKYGTRQGVSTPEQWSGFLEVWREAAALNQIVLRALGEAGLPAIALQPSASIIAWDGVVFTWDLAPLRFALQARLLPVVYGDVVFDLERGGTILSTEEILAYSARYLKPRRLLIAGLEPGVWADYPACTQLFSEITPESLSSIETVLQGSMATDVTGGMASKVSESLSLIAQVPGLEVQIFSGEKPGQVRDALGGKRLGTIIRNPDAGS